MPYPQPNVLNSPLSGVVSRSTESYTGGVAITPSDSTDLASMIRGLMVASAGYIKVTMVDGTTPTLYLTAGIIYPLVITRVWAASLTASGVVGLY